MPHFQAGGSFLIAEDYAPSGTWQPTGTQDLSKVAALTMPAASVINGGAGIPGSSLAANVMQVATGTLSAAQIITLHSVPVTLVPAPGAGKALVVDMAFFSFVYNSVQFTGGGAISLVQHGLSVNQLAGTIAAASITAAASYSAFFIPVQTAGGTLTTSAANLGLDLSAATADFAAGNSTMNWQINYTVVTL